MRLLFLPAITVEPEDVPVPAPALAPLRVMTWTEDDANKRYPTASCPDLVSDCTTSKVHLATDGERVWFDAFAHTDLWNYDKCIDPATGLPTSYRYLRPHLGIAAMKQHTLDAIATWQAQGLTRIDYISDDAETRWLKDKVGTAWQQALVNDARWETELWPEYNAELRRQTGDPDAVFYWNYQAPAGYAYADYDVDVHNGVFWGEVFRAMRLAKKEPINEWCGRSADHPDGRHYVGESNYENGGQPYRRDLDPAVDGRTAWVYGEDQVMNRMEGIDAAPTAYGNRIDELSGVGAMNGDGEDGVETPGSAFQVALADFRQIGAARMGADLDPDAEGKGMAPGGENEIAVSPWFGWTGYRHTINSRRYRSVPDPETEVDSPHLVNPYWRTHLRALLMASGQYAGRRTPPRYFNSRTAFSSRNCNDFCDREAQAIIAEHRSLFGDGLPRHPVRTGEFAPWFAGPSGMIATLTHHGAIGLRDSDGRAHYVVMIERKHAPLFPDQDVIDSWQACDVSVLREGVVIDTLTVPAGACDAYYSDPDVSAVDLTFEVVDHETAPDLASSVKDISLWGAGEMSLNGSVEHPLSPGAPVYRAPSSGGAVAPQSPLVTLTGASAGQAAVAHLYVRQTASRSNNVGFALYDSAGEQIGAMDSSASHTVWESRYVRFFVPDDLMVRFELSAYRNYATDPMIYLDLTTPALPA